MRKGKIQVKIMSRSKVGMEQTGGFKKGYQTPRIAETHFTQRFLQRENGSSFFPSMFQMDTVFYLNFFF